MEKETLRKTLETHLDTLRRNLAVVSMEELKTKYQKPYQVLAKDICTAATAYTREISLSGLRIKKQYFDEARPCIEAAIAKSTKLKEVSHAAFKRQDIEEIERLSLELRQEIQVALHPFYLRNLCLYVTADCLENPGMMPELYNDVTGCIWRDGSWQPLDDTSGGRLFFMQERQGNTEASSTAYSIQPAESQNEKKAS